MAEFFQAGPELKNQYSTDHLLQTFLRTYIPRDVFQEIEPDLRRFGERVATDVLALGVEAEKNPPKLVPFDPWGRPAHRLEVSPAWAALDRVSAEEGLIAIGYERKQSTYSRLYQFAKVYLFHPSSAYYFCPLAMTDGAAKLIEKHGDAGLRERAYMHLTSRDPAKFWTSGQWMTERSGGSDVSGTDTIAKPDPSADGARYRLYGTKWFTSAITSQMAMTLAREEGQDSLSLFYLELREGLAQGRDAAHLPLNHIEVLRLKDKMGTKALPTAELKLVGTRAQRVGKSGDGVKNIASLFNITRINNAAAAISTSRRMLALLLDYSEKRVAFKSPIIQKPLHRDLLADLIADFTGCFLFAFHASRLLGEEECDAAKAETSGKLLRLITPLAKLFTAKMNLKIASECVEGFGGAGYIEDVGIAKHLRDSQVLAIWEGTTNVLSLDVLRAIHRENVLPHFFADVEQRLESVNDNSLARISDEIREEANDLQTLLDGYVRRDFSEQESRARVLAFDLSKVFIKSLLLDFAFRTKSPEYRAVLLSWMRRHRIHSLAAVDASAAGLILKGF